MEAFGLSLSRPLALLFLLALVPLAIYLSRTSMALMRPRRRRWSLALRIILITLLVLALGGLGIVRAADRLSVVFLVDRSDSISADARLLQTNYINAAIGDIQEGDQAGVVVFGADALIDRPVSGEIAAPDLASKPTDTYSDIEEAIRLALSILPIGYRSAHRAPIRWQREPGERRVGGTACCRQRGTSRCFAFAFGGGS